MSATRFRSMSAACYSPLMSLPSASLLTASARTHALMNGTTARICDEDGLIKFPTEDGPEWFACHGCAGCNPASSQVIGPRPAPPADPFARLPKTDDEEW